MSIERSYRVSSLLLVASAFLGLTLAAEIPWPMLMLAAIALTVTLSYAAGWGLVRLGARLLAIPTEVWNVLLVLAFIACTADAVWGSQDVLLAGINFLVVLMVNKVLNLRERKDFLYLYAISLLQLLATAALTVEPWYAVVFVFFLLASIWTLLLYHLRHEAEDAGGGTGAGAGQAPPAISARFFWTTNVIALAALVITVAIFFITPRAGAGFFQKGRGQAIRTSGFSQTVDLGMIGSVKLDPTVVMRVQFPDQAGPSLGRVYLRGAAYDRYTGRTWINSLAQRHAIRQRRMGTFIVSEIPRPTLAEAGVRQDILIEALDAPVLFGVPEVKRIQGNFLVLHQDRIGGIHLPYPPTRRFEYSVLSVPNRLEPEDELAPSFSYPDQIRKYYLQLPRLSTRIWELARQVTRNAATPYEQVAALKWHLIKEYRYSLEVGGGVPARPLEEFLFTRKTGYCEHYATAMVVMLRSLGIPARLATGFLAGEWNDFGNYYTVRQQDAHAWVEVYFPRSGWIILDPTPSLVAGTESSPRALLARFIDSFRLKWTRMVIQYSFRDQQAVLEEIRDRSQPARSQASESLTVVLTWIKNWRAWLADRSGAWDWRRLFVVVAALAVIVMLARLWRRSATLITRYVPAQCTTQQRAATRVYGRMLHMLESSGLPKPSYQAPLEFAGIVGGRWSDTVPVVRQLTELYCRGRFGPTPLTTDDMRTADALLSRLRATLRRQRASRAPTTGATRWGSLHIGALRALRRWKGGKER